MPRPAPFMYAGMFERRGRSSIAASVRPARPDLAAEQDRTASRRATSRSASRSIASGSPALTGRGAVAARPRGSAPSRPGPWRRGRRAGSPGRTGPGAPWKHSRKAIDTMSATRSVSGTVAANLVIGVIMSTCGRSCSEPILCWLSAPWPPISSIGLSARKALATPVTASVVPGPGGDDRAAGLAGDARVAVGGVGGDLLVADVDDLDALVDAAVVDVDDVAAAEGVDHVDALGLQRLGDQVTAGDRFRHRAPFFVSSAYCIPYERNGYPLSPACLAPCGQLDELHGLS